MKFLTFLIFFYSNILLAQQFVEIKKRTTLWENPGNTYLDCKDDIQFPVCQQRVGFPVAGMLFKTVPYMRPIFYRSYGPINENGIYPVNSSYEYVNIKSRNIQGWVSSDSMISDIRGNRPKRYLREGAILAPSPRLVDVCQFDVGGSRDCKGAYKFAEEVEVENTITNRVQMGDKSYCHIKAEDGTSGWTECDALVASKKTQFLEVEISKEEKKTEASVIIECKTCVKPSQLQTQMKEVITKNSYRQPLNFHFNPKCEMFIKDDGSYGYLGKLIEGTLSKPEYEVFLNNNTASVSGMNTVCPNFKNMTKEERAFFWVWTFASIAQKESSCNPNAKAIGVSCKERGKKQSECPKSSDKIKAVGLLQLEEPLAYRSPRSISLRSEMNSKDKSKYNFCSTSNILKSENNILCGVDIMLGTLVGQYGTPKVMGRFGGTIYWQEMNDDNDKIIKRMKELKICQKK